MAEARACGKRNIRPIPIALGILVGALASMAPPAAGQPAERALDALTVPSDRLPSGCRLRPPPERSATSARVVVGPQMLSENPWIGDDRRTVAMIHARMDDSPRVPDGPPLDRRRATEYALKWADGVAGAYRATYVSPDLMDIDVYAVRFDNGTLKARVFARNTADSCFQAVRNHVQSVK